MPAFSSPLTNLHISHVCLFLFSPFCLLATGTFSPGTDVTALPSGGRHGAPGGQPKKYLSPEQSLISDAGIGVVGQILQSACHAQQKVTDALPSHQSNNTLLGYSHRGRPLTKGGHGREGVRGWGGGAGRREGRREHIWRLK